MAGGHLGYSLEDLNNLDADSLIKTFISVKKYLSDANLNIPVIVAGGIFRRHAEARTIFTCRG